MKMSYDDNDHREMTITEKPGGTILVQVGSSGPEAPAESSSSGPGTFHNQGTTRYQVSTGQMVIEGPNRFNAATVPSGIDTGEIMATCRDPQGRPVSDHSKITDDCSVEVGGVRTTVASSRRMGYLTVANGVYYDSAHANEQPEAAPSKQRTSGNVNSGPIADRQTAQTIENLRAENFDYFNSMMAKAIGRMTSGKDGSQAAIEIADDLGLGTAEEGAEIFNTLILNMQEHAYKMVQHYYGIDAEDAGNFVHFEMTPEARNQFLLRLLHGDQRAISDLAERYQLRNRF
jgi:hypothetical protein